MILNEKRKIQKQIKQQQKEELERKAQLIQQIRLIELAQNKMPVKDIDLTESSGLGLLGEMSVAEVWSLSSTSQITKPPSTRIAARAISSRQGQASRRRRAKKTRNSIFEKQKRPRAQDDASKH